MSGRWAGNHLHLLLKEQVAIGCESLKLVVFKDNPLVVALTFSSGKTFTAKTECQSTSLSVQKSSFCCIGPLFTTIN